jgi:MoxR-like ATPase
MVVNFAAESDGVTSDAVIDRIVSNTPTAQDELLRDARFQRILAS